MSKSHVGMGFKLCPVCLEKTDEVVLLDRRLKDSLERDNWMGWQMCEMHQQQTNDGYIHLIIIKNPEGSAVDLRTADRTGETVSVRRAVFQELFNTNYSGDIAFGSQDLLEKIKALPVGE